MRVLLIVIATIFCSAILGQTSIKLSSINFDGNNRSKKEFLLNYITLEENVEYDSSEYQARLNESLENLNNSMLFIYVSSLLEISQSMKLTFVVQERWYVWPNPKFRIHETNFNTWLKSPDLRRASYGLDLQVNNIKGNGGQLGIGGTYGYLRGGKITYYQPFLAKSKYALIAGLLYHQRDEFIYGTRQNLRQFYRNENTQSVSDQTQGYLGTQYMFTQRAYLKLLLGHQNFNLDDSLALLNEILPEKRSNASLNSLYLQFRNDNRNNSAYPTQGSFSDIGLHLYQWDDGKHDIKMFAEYRNYQQLGAKWYSGVGIKVRGFINRNVPYILQDGLGYRYYIRSFESVVLDNQYYALFKSVLKYKLMDKVWHIKFLRTKQFNRVPMQAYITGFVDAGYFGEFKNNLSENTYNDEILTGYGIGLDLSSYYDRVIRFETSYNVLLGLGFYVHFTQAF